MEVNHIKLSSPAIFKHAKKKCNACKTFACFKFRSLTIFILQTNKILAILTQVSENYFFGKECMKEQKCLFTCYYY